MVSNTDKKINELQQNQFLESETIESMLANIMSILQDNDNYVVMAVLIDCQCATEEDSSAKEDWSQEEPPKEEQLPEESPNQEQQTPNNTDNRPINYYGRLYVPDAGIDVALYYGAQQEICDRQDSANIFTMSVFDGIYIADHNTQEFGKLFNVTVGMRGYLQLADGEVFNIVCTDVLNGRNTGNHVVDKNGNTNLDADYLMYTCRDGRQNILICLWKHC
jgi:sortase (surface protein transpeptidase)